MSIWGTGLVYRVMEVDQLRLVGQLLQIPDFLPLPRILLFRSAHLCHPVANARHAGSAILLSFCLGGPSLRRATLLCPYFHHR